MGRILVIFFLLAIVLGVVGAFFAADQVVRFLWHDIALDLPGRPLPIPPPQPPPLQWGGPVYRLVVLFFGLAVPGAIITQFVADRVIPPRKSTWRVPPPIDLRKEPVAAVLTAYNDELSIGLAV
ncbi:MAG: hypothetical protein ACREEC_14430, partial [Thermoplasmata archaeon]